MDIYGEPSAELMDLIHAKLRMLGNATLTVHRLHSGFRRFRMDEATPRVSAAQA